MTRALASRIGSRRLFASSLIFAIAMVGVHEWFIPGLTITNVDIGYPILTGPNVIEHLSLFSQQRGLGLGLGNANTSLPFALLVHLSDLLFASQGQYWVYTLITVMLGWSTLYLLNSCFRIYGSRRQLLIAVVVAVWQMFSLYLAFVWVRLQTALFIAILLLLLSGVLIRMARERRHTARRILFLWATLLAFGWSLSTQPPIAIWTPLYMVILIYIASRSSSPKSRKPAVLRTVLLVAVTGLLFILTNLWWLVTYVSYILGNGFLNRGVIAENFDVFKLASMVSPYSTASNGLRQMGDFPWFTGYLPQLEPWASNGLLVAFSYVPAVLVVASLAWRPDRYRGAARISAFYVAIFSGSVLLSTGNAGLIAALYDWALENFPFFSLQRAPWQKFGMYTWLAMPVPTFVGLTLLFGQQQIRKSRIWTILLTTTIVGASLLGTYSLVYKGEMFSRGWGPQGWHETNGFGYHLEIPDYVLDMSSAINDSLNDTNVLLLPDSRVNAYEWGWGAPWDVTWQTLRTGVAIRNYGEGMLPPSAETVDSRINDAFQSLLTSDGDALYCQLQELAIGAILVRNDFKSEWIQDSARGEGVAVEDFEAALGERKGLEHQFEIGNWSLYTLSPDLLSGAKTITIRPLSFKDASCPARAEPEEIDLSRNLSGSLYVIDRPSHDGQSYSTLTLREGDLQAWKAVAVTNEVGRDEDWVAWWRQWLVASGAVLMDTPSTVGAGKALIRVAGYSDPLELPRLGPGEWGVPAGSNSILLTYSGDAYLFLGVTLTAAVNVLVVLSWLLHSLLGRRVRVRRREGVE